MTELPRWQDIVSRVIGLRTLAKVEEAPITYDQLVGEDLALEQVAEMMVVLGEVATSAAIAKKTMAQKLSSLMDTTKMRSIEVAGVLITWKPKKTMRCVDEDGFWEYMLANPGYLRPGFNPNNLRKTGIPQAVFDTFFKEEESTDPVLSEIPMFVIEENRNKKERQHAPE